MFNKIDPLVKVRATKLRLRGYSYGSIIRELGIKSKGTLSAWFRDIKLSPEAKALLLKNNELATKRGLRHFNNIRTARIETENETALEQGNKLIGSMSDRDLTILGSSLYWGEGTKNIKGVKYQSLRFTNSDPAMVRVFIVFLIKILKIQPSKLRGGIHLYKNTDKQSALNYWSNVTKISKNRFYVYEQLTRLSQQKRDPRKLPYGTVVVLVNERPAFYRVTGMIQALSSMVE